MDPDVFIQKMLEEVDDTIMPLPSIESDPHILISKIRKYYFDYIIKLLSMNYEGIHKLGGKKLQLPSAIWRCAKLIEMNAARSCMLVELYRRNILVVIKNLKLDIKRSKLNKHLWRHLRTRPVTDKKVQTSFVDIKRKDCICKCTCNTESKVDHPNSPLPHSKVQNYNIEPLGNGFDDLMSPCTPLNDTFNYEDHYNDYECNNLIGAINHQNLRIISTDNSITHYGVSPQEFPKHTQHQNVSPQEFPKHHSHTPHYQTVTDINESIPTTRLSIESLNTEDEVMLQMEQLFRADTNEDEDIFEGTLCDNSLDFSNNNIDLLKPNLIKTQDLSVVDESSTNIVHEQAAKIKSLDERLALLESTGLLTTKNVCDTTSDSNVCDTTNDNMPKNSHNLQKQIMNRRKWLCENYYKKLKLYETLDEIRDRNRKKHARIKRKFVDLFGEDSEDEQVMSPLNETPEFVLSCKERIAPWVVNILTPHYVKGRIRGKMLFKATARHLLKLIYQCSKYPSESDVRSFVNDFLKSHPVIKSEADYKAFRIENL